MQEQKEQQQDDQPLGTPPPESQTHRPDAPFKKRGNVKLAIIVGILIIIIDVLIYFFLIRPDDEELLKAIEPLKPPETTQTVSPPTTAETGEPKTSTGAQLEEVTRLAKEDLAKRLDKDVSEIDVVYQEAVTWNDGSMGCPQPDMLYTQALVEGSKVVLSDKKENYDYHAGPDDKPFLCENATQ